MSSPVKFVVYTAIFLVVGAVIYFFAFLQPNGNRIEQLRLDIEAARAELEIASQRDDIHPQLQTDVYRLREELSQEQSAWEHASQEWTDNYARFLPEVFDDGDMWQRIHHIVYPHSDVFHVDFLYSQPLGVMRYSDNNPNGPPEGIWLTPVDVTFLTGYEGLIAILTGFANAGIDNRVIEYTLSRQNELWDVRLRLDILTQTSHSHRYNGDYTVYPYEN